MKHYGDITKINGTRIKEIYLCGRVYYVSENGEVWNRYGKAMSIYIDPRGYAYVGIKRQGEKKRVKFRIHRLVANAFIPNPEQLPQVNHIDGDKANNKCNNLEWVTGSQNILHCRYVLGKNTGFQDTPVKCAETGKIYRSTRAAWRATGVNYCHISECVNGKRSSAGGYHWEKEET